MKLEDLEKQLQELQQINTSTLTPEQLQELIDKLASITDMGEEMLSKDIQELENDNNENESYDEDDA